MLTVAVIAIVATFVGASAGMAHWQGRQARRTVASAVRSLPVPSAEPMRPYVAHLAYPHLAGSVPDCAGCRAYASA